jgi:hypothetical protein
MLEKWNQLKAIKGMKLEMIYEKVLHVYQNRDQLILQCTNPLIHFGPNHNDINERYWLLEWEETLAGDDVLIVKSQPTPDPFDYELYDHPSQKYMLAPTSGYHIRDNSIIKIKGYGINKDLLTSLVIELERSFLHIAATPAIIEIRMTGFEPVIREHERLLFTS